MQLAKFAEVSANDETSNFLAPIESKKRFAINDVDAAAIGDVMFCYINLDHRPHGRGCLRGEKECDVKGRGDSVEEVNLIV